MTNKLCVALLMGGPSSEHEVSLASAEVVAGELDGEKYEVIPVRISRSGEWSVGIEELSDSADIAFIALHGEFGEDGTVQEMLRDAGIPYTGSDVLSSALAMNKILASRLLSAHGLFTPPFFVVQKHEWQEEPIRGVLYPVVVKPADRGSSVGVSVVRSDDELVNALRLAFGLSRDAMVQDFIHGREITCAVIDDGAGDAVPLPPTEIIPKAGTLFDYRAKYTPGASEEITPARLSRVGLEMVQATALVAHKAVGASGMSRTDMIISEDNTLYVFEVNTIPGMTKTSLLPQAARAHGLSLGELFERIIEAGLRRHGLLLREAY